MPRKDKQLTERQKLKRDFEEWTALQELWKRAHSSEGDAEAAAELHAAALKRWLMHRNQLTAADLRRRNERWIEMGRPELRSREWRAELEHLRRPLRGKKQRVLPAGTDLADLGLLYWVLMHLSAGAPAGPREEAVLNSFGLQLTPEGRVKLPGQSQERHTKAEQTEARRMYRWLWRTFPGLLNACDDELRALIRGSGGAA